ncbi:uncharacterized protein LOC131934377 [Physella acuta]|uniref:uncharacterized protein LOC131934377 n=1 Tax=Physella acuta TaxID=109671 RepID=UPI0027DBBC7C|nr:uncharacterized protein LOC131934377 [Physella acuta]XP_059146498.1 uncharacterized protein LOC131934377 [Physella acuta]
MAEASEAATVNIELNDEVKIDHDQTAQQGTQPDDFVADEDGTEELPPLTYKDFVPECLGVTIEGKEPDYAEFSTVIEQANQWLQTVPQFTVFKCETISVKLGADFVVENDVTLSHQSSNGRNVYLRILRVWLIKKQDLESPVQQLGYITVLPEHSSGDLTTYLNSLATSAANKQLVDLMIPSFDNIKQTLEKINRHLLSKPIPGQILNMETLVLKCQEASTTDKLDTEKATYTEGGGNSKLFLYGFRIFYVVGKPSLETVGFYDEQPDIFQTKEDFGLKIKFATFNQTLAKAAKWLKKQKGIRVTNIQSVTVKLDRNKCGSGPWSLETTVPGYTENQSLVESRYTKIIRIYYVNDPKTKQTARYADVTMASRLFIPQRIEGRMFEGFSKTLTRTIKWLHKTGLPLFACETVKYHLTNDSEGQGFNDERLDYMVNTYHGQLYISCIRLYFPCTFEEPPPDKADGEDLGWGWGWACVVS